MSPLAPLRGEIDKRAQSLFCMKFNFKQLLSEAFFDAMRIFGSVEPQTVSTFPFLYIIIFQRGESFDLPSYTLRRGEIDICASASGLFCTKFNFEQLLFKPFFDATRIFGGVEP